MTVEARNPSIPAPVLLDQVRPVLEALDLPPGYRWEIGGEIEDQAEANTRLFGLLPPALAGIVIC